MKKRGLSKRINKLSKQGRRGSLAALALVFVAVSFPTASMAETRGFVVSFLHATNREDPRNCPKGGNGGSSHAQLRAYKAAGLSEEEIAAIVRGEAGPSNGLKLIEVRNMRGRVNGKPARIAFFPETVPDPQLETVSGPYAYGFDLDGKGPGTPNTFEDPETGEQGVDNQLFRALGCFSKYSADLPIRPLGEEDVWRSYLPLIHPPAWVMSISGEDLSRDGEVTVSFYRAIEYLRLDRSGQGLADITYTIDPSGRGYGTFTGTLKDGVFTSEPEAVKLMLAGEFPVFTKFELSKARLRLAINADRTATGYIAGYQPWMDFRMLNVHSNEDQGISHVALYHLLKRLADAEPDPQTGQNTAISATYRIEMVPAFLAHPDGHFLTTAP